MNSHEITEAMQRIWSEAANNAATPDMVMIKGVIFSAAHPYKASTDGGVTFHDYTEEEVSIVRKWNLLNKD